MVDEGDGVSALIFGIRNEFLESLTDKTELLEAYVLDLGSYSPELETFNELFRALHNIKGTGGSHGLFHLVSICHQFEDILVAARTAANFDADFVNKSLLLVDLIREVVECEVKADPYAQPDYSEIENKLAHISQREKSHVKKILISDSSRTMARFYFEVFKGIDSISADMTANGVDALKRLLTIEYDLLICACEQKALGGIALSRALRASNSKNSGIPIILICNSDRKLPVDNLDKEKISTINRDENLTNNLLIQVQKTLDFDELQGF